MKYDPKISVVIPSFNKVKYIKKTLLSIINQDYQNVEIIVQDGASTDGTVDIINKFVKNYKSFFKFESKADNGQLDAINKGLKRATGDILTFLNADDIYLKGALRSVANTYNHNPDCLWMVGKAKVINEKDLEIAKWVTIYKSWLLNNFSFNKLLLTNFLMQPAVFLTKKSYRKYGPFTGTSNFVMEYDLWLKLANESAPVVINDYLASFRIESTTKTKTMFDSILKEDQKIIKKYNPVLAITFVHSLHNVARKIIGRFV